MAHYGDQASASYELLIENPANFPRVLDALFEGVYFVDTERRIHSWSAAATAMTGFCCDEVRHRQCGDNILVHVDEKGAPLCRDGCPLQQTLVDGQSRNAKVFLRHKQGYRVPVAISIVPVRNARQEIVGAVEAFREVADADQWNARVKELEAAVYIDALTGIPNRRFLEGQIERLLREFHSTHEPFVLFLIDVDHFKTVNDTYGHDVGDRALWNVSHTLANTLRGRDILGRWGGDEFVMLLANTGAQQCPAIAERACSLVAQTATPSPIGLIKLPISIGAAVSEPDDDPSRLLKRADEQLYYCKQHGRGRWALAQGAPAAETTAVQLTARSRA